MSVRFYIFEVNASIRHCDTELILANFEQLQQVSQMDPKFKFIKGHEAITRQ